MKNLLLLSFILIAVQGFSQKSDPAINGQIRYNEYSDYVKNDHIRSSGTRDTLTPSFTISHSVNGDITVHVVSDEDLFAGWVEEKDIWSNANFDYWWLNTRLAKDTENNVYAAVKLFEYSNMSNNFDLFVLFNNGEIQMEINDWNGPDSNPLIVNFPNENIYLGHPTIDPEGVVSKNNITYIAATGGGSNIQFTKIDAKGNVLINNETIITGANAWTNEARIAVNTNEKIYIVWSKDLHDISYAYSEDGGDTWSERISLSYNASHQMVKPQVCCDCNNNIHIIWQRWTSGSDILAYMKLRPDGTITIDESHLTQNNNWVWSARMDIDIENNLHIVWVKDYNSTTSAYYTKIDGNLDGNGASLTDAELTIIQEQPFLSSQNIRYPKCVADEYLNVHTIYEKGEYGCNTSKSVYYKKMNFVPLLKIGYPNDSVLFVEMTGDGTTWEGTFTPTGNGNYNVRVSGSDTDGNTGVDYYQFEYISTNIHDNESLTDNSELLTNCPNPFYNETQIFFHLINAGKTELAIYNMSGQKIRTLTNSFYTSGKHSVIWDGKNNLGESVGPGIYFYQLIVYNKSKAVNKCLLLK